MSTLDEIRARSEARGDEWYDDRVVMCASLDSANQLDRDIASLSFEEYEFNEIVIQGWYAPSH